NVPRSIAPDIAAKVEAEPNVPPSVAPDVAAKVEAEPNVPPSVPPDIAAKFVADPEVTASVAPDIAVKLEAEPNVPPSVPPDIAAKFVAEPEVTASVAPDVAVKLEAEPNVPPSVLPSMQSTPRPAEMPNDSKAEITVPQPAPHSERPSTDNRATDDRTVNAAPPEAETGVWTRCVVNLIPSGQIAVWTATSYQTCISVGTKCAGGRRFANIQFFPQANLTSTNSAELCSMGP